MDEEKLKTTRRRNFVYQCCANHVDPRPLLPGFEKRAPFRCPHCGVPVDGELEAKERQELENLSPNQRLVKLNKHCSDHAGALRGKRPNLPMDHRFRSRGLLHRRMNVVSNCLAATFLRVPFDEKKRIAANAHLEKHKMLWRMPEKQGKRAKTISAGNDARRMVTAPAILAGMVEIFWDEEARAAATAEIDKLCTAATENEGMRCDAPEPKQAKPRQRKQAAKAPARKSPVGVAGGGVAKKSAKKKKVVGAVLTVGAQKVTQADCSEYAKKRRRADSAAAAPAPDDTSRVPAAAPAMPAADAAEHELDGNDESMQAEDEEMEHLEEDDKVGGLSTAIDVWLTAIKYLSDLHTPVKDHFDMVQRKAYADKCAASGKAWALTINEHTSNKALWQYVHDAFAHVHEDIMEHGAGDRNDDAILEKGNRCATA